MGVRLPKCYQIISAQEMKHEEIVPLAYEFGGDRSRLLGYQNAAEVILATLLGPLNENRLRRIAFS